MLQHKENKERTNSSNSRRHKIRTNVYHHDIISE